MAKANAKRAREESKALEEASDKKKPATRSIPDDAAKSPRAMSTRELISKYNSMEPSTERTRIAKEIKRMAASEPEVSGVKIGKEAKRLIAENGAKLNDEPLTDAGLILNAADLAQPIKLSAGKKRHALVQLG